MGAVKSIVFFFALVCLLVVAAPARAEHEKSETQKLAADPMFPKDPEALEHVIDDENGTWELFFIIHPHHIHLPKITIGKYQFQITKFMVLEVIASLLVLMVYIPLARRLQSGAPPRGSWQNAFESVLTFIREQLIARPTMGDHDADKYVPFLWTLFMFILFNNLLGMVPFGASATGSIYVTMALQLCVFFAIHGCAIAKMGFAKYAATLWPHLDVPFRWAMSSSRSSSSSNWSACLSAMGCWPCASSLTCLPGTWCWQPS